jgi:signal transduction histidine kinase
VTAGAAPRRRAPSLFAQVLLMLLALVLIVQAANAAMILIVPPPRPDFYRLDEVVRVLRGDRSAEALKGLKLETRARAPRPASAPPGAPAFETGLERIAQQALAERLGVPQSHVQVETRRRLPFLMHVRQQFQREREQREGPPPGGAPPRDQLFIGGEPRPPEGEILLRGPPPAIAIYSRGAGARLMQAGGGPPLVAPFKVSLLQTDGSWLVIESRQSFPTPWQQRILLWLAICASLCVPLAWVYARWLAAPIRQFAEAADRLGGDPGAAELDVSGPAEVRMAGEAFNRMQDRLQRYIENRTTIVGAVAHDLRTPLARMRFLLETPTDDMRQRLAREIDEMDAMVGATMAFVRDSTAKAARADLDLPSLLETLADDAAEEGHDVAVVDLAPAVVHGDPVGLRRLFDNVIRNGIKFATCVRLHLRVEGDEAVVEVVDDGPGLPPHDLERVFEPFYRGEASRSRETGGIGLGLAVVRSIARAHGGDAVMINRPSGGLICRVRLPLRKAT